MSYASRDSAFAQQPTPTVPSSLGGGRRLNFLLAWTLILSHHYSKNLQTGHGAGECVSKMENVVSWEQVCAQHPDPWSVLSVHAFTTSQSMASTSLDQGFLRIKALFHSRPVCDPGNTRPVWSDRPSSPRGLSASGPGVCEPLREFEARPSHRARPSGG